MSTPPWRVRVATEADRALIARFRCADPAVAWQVEVETYVRTRLLDWALAPGAVADEPRALFVLHRRTRTLLAVAAHERLLLQATDASGSKSFYGTRLQVVAVATKWQAKKLGGVRISDVVNRALDALLEYSRAAAPAKGIENYLDFVQSLPPPDWLPTYEALIRHCDTSKRPVPPHNKNDTPADM